MTSGSQGWASRQRRLGRGEPSLCLSRSIIAACRPELTAGVSCRPGTPADRLRLGWAAVDECSNRLLTFLWPGVFKNPVTMATILPHLHMQLARRSPSPKKKKPYFTQLKLGLPFPLERLLSLSTSPGKALFPGVAGRWRHRTSVQSLVASSSLGLGSGENFRTQDPPCRLCKNLEGVTWSLSPGPWVWEGYHGKRAGVRQPSGPFSPCHCAV